MLKWLKIRNYNKDIRDICNRNGYELLGRIRKSKIDDGHWSFAIKTPEKILLVKLIVPFGYFNTGLCFNSPEYISASATVFAMRGLFGAIDIPMSRDYHFKLPEIEFDIESENLEKIYLIFPKCTQFYVRELDKIHLSTFRVGLKLGEVSFHDGASFKYLLEHPNEVRKFAEFGE